MDIRNKMREDIVIVLTKKISRDNKNHYCETHAMDRAIVIENSLYRNCTTFDKENWLKLYSGVDIPELINKIEEKTTKCIYND